MNITTGVFQVNNKETWATSIDASLMDIEVCGADSITNGHNPQFFSRYLEGGYFYTKNFYFLFASEKNVWFVLLAKVIHEFPTMPEKCPYSEFFWSVFSPIRTEHGKILSISLHSVRMLENKEQKNSKYGQFSRSAKCDRDKVVLWLKDLDKTKITNKKGHYTGALRNLFKVFKGRSQ